MGGGLGGGLGWYYGDGERNAILAGMAAGAMGKQRHAQAVATKIAEILASKDPAMISRALPANAGRPIADKVTAGLMAVTPRAVIAATTNGETGRKDAASDPFGHVLDLAASNDSKATSQLLAVKKEVGAEQWPAVATEAAKSLGADDAGKFSANKFAEAYGAMPANGKTALFGANRQALDEITGVAQEDASGGAKAILAALFDEDALGAGGAVQGAMASPAAFKQAANVARVWKGAKAKGTRESQLQLQLTVRTLAAEIAKKNGGDERVIAEKIGRAMIGGK